MSDGRDGDTRACAEERQTLHAYLDGELQLAEATELEKHVRGCDACRQELAVVGALRKALKQALPATRAPAELRARVSALVAGRAEGAAGARPAPAPLHRRVGGALLAAAAGVLTVTGGLALASRLLPRGADDHTVPNTPRPAPLALAVADLHEHTEEVALDALGPGDDQVTALLETRARLPGHPVAPEEADLLGARLVSFSPDDARPMRAALPPIAGRPLGRGYGAAAGGGAGAKAAMLGQLAGEVHYFMRGYPVTVLVFDVRGSALPVAGLAGPYRFEGDRHGYITRVGETHEVFFADGPLGYAVASTAPVNILVDFVGGTVSVP